MVRRVSFIFDDPMAHSTLPVPPFIPSLDPLDPADTSQFDDTYTSQMPRVSNEDGTGAPGDEREVPEGEPQAAFDEAVRPFAASKSRSLSSRSPAQGHDVFDGYSYFGGRDADSIVGPDPDDDDEVPIAVTPSPSELPDAFLDDADLDADNSGLADQTFSSMASISTPGTSIVHLSPEQPRRRQRSEGLDSLVEAPSSAENDMMVEEPDADDGDGEQSEEDDWDVIDANVGGEARNGGKGTTLWAKGVKDRFVLWHQFCGLAADSCALLQVPPPAELNAAWTVATSADRASLERRRLSEGVVRFRAVVGHAVAIALARTASVAAPTRVGPVLEQLQGRAQDVPLPALAACRERKAQALSVVFWCRHASQGRPGDEAPRVRLPHPVNPASPEHHPTRPHPYLRERPS